MASRTPKKRFQYTDWKGKRRTATGTTSWKQTEKLAQKTQDQHDLIRKGYLPPPSKANKHKERKFSDVRAEYLAWGKSQGGRKGRPWGKGHARMREAQLTWWGETLDTNDSREIGWRLSPEYWGQGLATEAARTVVQHGFDTLNFGRIIATVQPENSASIRIIEKLGMQYESSFERHGQNVF